MSNSAYGLVHDYYPREKMISIKWDNKISYFYFSKNLFKHFEKAMIYSSVFVFFDFSLKTTKVLKNVTAYQITELHRITVETSHGPMNLYTISSSRESTMNDFDSYEYKMFIDFEFTMPEFGEKNPFEAEILQVGAVISNKENKIVNEYSNYIKTNKKVSLRTLRFLRIYSHELEDSITPVEFYNDLKNLIKIYNPTFFVWGSSDVKELDYFYKINNLEPLKIKVVDLLKVIRNFYNLNSDIGLFRCLKYFKNIKASQAHHALTDAAATKEVYDAFIDVMNTDFDLKEIIIKEEENKESEEIKEE